MPPTLARAQLERIVGGDTFARVPQLRRFLVYVVEQALAGQGARLKEYVLGVEVFDRGADFNPRTDPIVRVDARRLRARLENYYRSEGTGDPVEIAFAKGSYAPNFRHRTGPPPATPRIEPIRLVVLPMQSIAGGAEDTSFAEGLGDELVLALARRPEIRVVGPASASRLVGERHQLGEISRRLNARLMLEGKVRRQGTQLRVMVALRSATDGAEIWSERYDATIAKAEEIFALQDRMARQIVEQMTPRVRESEAARRRPTSDVAAFELYLRGRHQLYALNPAMLPQAIGFLDAAVERDPGFALALTALSGAHFARAVYLMGSPIEAMRKSRQLARMAADVDPAPAGPHARLAVLSAVLDHDFVAAANGFARALSLDPLDAEARNDHACWFLAPLGRLDEAAGELADLVENDPYSLRLRLDHARILMFQRRYADAIGQLNLVLDMEPRYAPALLFLAFAYERNGQMAEARAAHERHVRDLPYPLVVDWFQAACAVWDGDAARAGAIADRMEATAANGPTAATVLADLHLRLGAHDRAITWLERAAEERIFRVVYLGVDPDYDVLRPEPRFQALLRRIGIADRVSRSRK